MSRRLPAALVAIVLVGGTLVVCVGSPAATLVPGRWTGTDAMATARYLHAATRLANGKVLVTGGYPATRAAELYTPSTGTWAPAANMRDARISHTATLLSDGRVLVTGGWTEDGSLATAEIYDPAANTWTRTGSMHERRADHFAQPLSNGKVLVGGSYDIRAAEIYDVATGRFTLTGPMNRSRFRPASIRLSSTKVLVAGGTGGAATTARTAEIYDSATRSWTPVGNMGTSRFEGHGAVMLGNGKVLVAGGNDSGFGDLSSTELFDPSTRTFSPTGRLNFARGHHAMTRLAGGKVLASGGGEADGSAEIYDPGTGQWDLTGSLRGGHRQFHSATLLTDGKVLVAGGFNGSGGGSELSTAERFNPSGADPVVQKLQPRVAWSGAFSFVVWQDDRNGNPDIYGARMDSFGDLLEREGIPISTAPGAQTEPTVAWNGSSFLVTWTDRRSGSDSDIYGTRVGRFGAVVTPGGSSVSTAPGDQSASVARANGSTWLVAWEDGRTGVATDIFGTRVTSAGAITNPGGVAISTAARGQQKPTIAANGSGWLVAWGDRRASDGMSDIYATRVTAAGSVSSPAGVVVSSAADDQTSPALAWNGTTYLAVWSDRRSPTAPDVYGSRLTASGVPVDAAGIAISRRAGVQTSPALTGLGSRFLVVWQDNRGGDFDIFATRVDSGGSVLSPTGTVINGVAQAQTMPAVGLNDERFFIVWSDRRFESGSDIYAQWTPDFAGQPAQGTLISG